MQDNLNVRYAMRKSLQNLFVGYALLVLLSFFVSIEFVDQSTNSSLVPNNFSSGPLTGEKTLYEVGYYRLFETEETGRRLEPVWSSAQW